MFKHQSSMVFSMNPRLLGLLHVTVWCGKMGVLGKVSLVSPTLNTLATKCVNGWGVVSEVPT